MKLRVMGTADECKQAQEFYRRLSRQSNVRFCTVSELYANRGSIGYYRAYIEIEYKDGSNLYSEVTLHAANSKEIAAYEDETHYPACVDDRGR